MKEIKDLALRGDLIGKAIKVLPAQYADPLRCFRRWLQKTGDGTLTLEAAEAYLAGKREGGFTDRSGERRPYTAAGYNHHVHALKALIRYLFENSPDLTSAQRLELENRLSGLKTRKRAQEEKQVGEDKVLKPAEVQELIARSGEKVSLFVELLAATGCRISEGLGIRVSQIKPAGAHIGIKIVGKGQKERTLRVSSELVDRIRAHFRGKTYLFETANGKPYRREYVFMQIRKSAKKILGKTVYPHMLRHTFATQLLGMYPEDLAGISAYLGHSRVSTTANLYVHGKLAFEKLNGYYAKIRAPRSKSLQVRARGPGMMRRR